MANESLKLGGLQLNGSTFSLQGVVFTPAQKKVQYVENADADGGSLVQESRYTNATFDLLVRIKQQASMDTALEKAGELVNALQSCERADGGQTLEWKPQGATTTYTAYALSADLLEVPTEMSGDMAGWLLKAPLARVRLTCKPFLYTEERTVKTATESAAEPVQILYVDEVKGDVPAEARAVITDKASQDRRYAEAGWDVVSAEEGDLLLTAADLTVTNFSGSSTTRSGAFSEEKVKRATAVSSPTTMCGTGVIPHVGTYRVLARVYTANENVRVRLAYRNGEGPLIPLSNPGWVAPPVLENFAQIDLGEVHFEEKAVGTQKGEIRIEVKSDEPAAVDLNYLILLPTGKGWMRARGLANNNPTKLLAYDTFLQTEGALSGKSAPLGGTWAGAGDTDDFTVVAASDIARRTAVSDSALNNGRYALVGSEEPTNAKATVDVDPGGTLGSGARRGVILRYGSTSNWIMAVAEPIGVNLNVLKVIKRVSGTETTIGLAVLTLKESNPTTVSLSVSDTGTWKAWAYAPGTAVEPEPLVEGSDSVLATGGSLAKGKGGFYDAQTKSGAQTRDYDNFSLLVGDASGRVLYSGKSAELRHDHAYLLQDSTGTYYGPPSNGPRGSSFYLQPEGDEGDINRIVLAVRRNDVVAEADGNVTDKHTVEVKATERYLAPR